MYLFGNTMTLKFMTNERALQSARTFKTVLRHPLLSLEAVCCSIEYKKSIERFQRRLGASFNINLSSLINLKNFMDLHSFSRQERKLVMDRLHEGFEIILVKNSTIDMFHATPVGSMVVITDSRYRTQTYWVIRPEATTEFPERVDRTNVKNEPIQAMWLGGSTGDPATESKVGQ